MPKYSYLVNWYHKNLPREKKSFKSFREAKGALCVYLGYKPREIKDDETIEKLGKEVTKCFI